MLQHQTPESPQSFNKTSNIHSHSSAPNPILASSFAFFGAAAWQSASRDHYIGWDSPVRTQHLQFIANNTRFLILPWVGVKSLASHILGRIARRLNRDWQAKYGHPIYLLETFVERGPFPRHGLPGRQLGAWAKTKGRTRQDQPDGTPHQVPIKDVYPYPFTGDSAITGRTQLPT
ncbi:MAG: DUF4338 domain-containing protein [Flavobacteriales bacterium]|nr:DUF4338 domain-containing protein [Flavobacteriales bacterium]